MIVSGQDEMKIKPRRADPYQGMTDTQAVQSLQAVLIKAKLMPDSLFCHVVQSY